MVRYTPAAQLSFPDFCVPSFQNLDPDNRWVRLAAIVPWDQLAIVLAVSPNAPNLRAGGRPTLDLRLVLAALLVQRIEDLSDERTVTLITENVYVQYFCGLAGFQTRRPFEASSLTHWRAWLGDHGAAELADTLAAILEERQCNGVQPSESSKPTALTESSERSALTEPSDSSERSAPTEPSDSSERSALTEPSDSSERLALSEPCGPAEPSELTGPADVSEPVTRTANEGTLLIDATCAPADITFPTDTGILNAARLSAEAILDRLWDGLTALAPETAAKLGAKPRTYRREAARRFAAFAMRRRPGAKRIRRCRREQLQYLERDLRHIDTLLAALATAEGLLLGEAAEVLPARAWTRLRVCHEVARQQRLMYDTGAQRCDDRIVSLSQPHIRPIVPRANGAGAPLASSWSPGGIRAEVRREPRRRNRARRAPRVRCLPRRPQRGSGLRTLRRTTWVLPRACARRPRLHP